MAGVPEGFIMPTLGTSLGAAVLKAYPAAETVAGAMGTMTAEVVRHKEYNAKRTKILHETGASGEMCDEIELVKIKTDPYSVAVLRASCLSDESREFHCELSVAQQVQLAELREKFRKNEHGSDTPIILWEALNTTERHKLVTLGVYYVEQLAAYKEHEYYKLGNGGAELVKRAQKFVQGKLPNKQDEFERNMSVILAEREKERQAREEAERKMYEMQERLAALEGGAPKRKGRQPRKAGIQEEAAA